MMAEEEFESLDPDKEVVFTRGKDSEYTHVYI